MNSTVDKLRQMFGLQIQAPFHLKIGDNFYEFQCLVDNYGAKNGMVIDKEWEKIAPIANELVAMGYGYSCFDIEKADIESFQDVLNDWGPTDT